MAKKPNDVDLRYTQNFLHSKTLVAKIVKLATIPAGSVVLEIGGGAGIITHQLVDAVGRDGRVVVVELDKNFARKLRDTFKDAPQVEIITADILQFDLTRFDAHYRVFANIPFSITATLLEHLFDPQHAPLSAHLILQQDTLMGTNKRGDTTETLKSLMIKPFYEIEVAYRFNRIDFNPAPSIDTALFAFTRRPEALIQASQFAVYKDFMAYVSKDRVGEGVWKRVFSKKQLTRLTDQTELVMNRGIKSQSLNAIVDAFQIFVGHNQSKLSLIQGAMSNLRDEQQRREKMNRAGGHHASKQREPTYKRKK